MKKAFTLLELIFVLVVIGILSTIILSATKSNKLQEAATQVISHIRYTQHLAMVDDKFNVNDIVWYKKRWQIIFGASENASGKDTGDYIAYSIFSDTAGTSSGSPNISELAKDPMNNGKYLSGGYSGIIDTYDPKASKKMNIGLTYNVKEVKFSNSCSSRNSRRLSFDNLGRPIRNPLDGYKKSYIADRLIRNPCIITLTSITDENISIVVEPETGYTYIR